MSAPIPLRSDFDAAQLRALAKRSRDPDQTRRLLTLRRSMIQQAHRGLVRRRGQDRSEEQDHEALGQARHEAIRA